MLPLLFLAFFSSQTYEKDYAPFMQECAPPIINATRGMQFPEVIYLNRHLSEFGVVSWNFSPSTNPHHFNEKLEPLTEDDLNLLKGTNTDALIVVKGNDIIHEYYAKGMYPSTRHAAYSVTKSWTSSIWADALIDHMEKSADSIVPQLKNTVYERVAIGDILDMRVPIEWNIDYKNPDYVFGFSGSTTGWDFKSTKMKHLDLITRLVKQSNEHSRDWNYVSPNTLLIEKLGERITGIFPYDKINRFYQDLGFEYMASTTANFFGESSAESGSSFTLRDSVKLAVAMANGGKIGDREVITPRYIDEVMTYTKDKVRPWQNSFLFFLTWGISHYSHQWYVVNEDIAFGIGSFGQYVIFNRKTKTAIAKFSTYEKGVDYWSIAKDLYWLLNKAKTL